MSCSSSGSGRLGGTVFDAPGVWTPSSEEPGSETWQFSSHTVAYPVLRGRARTNHEVVLLDVNVMHIFPEQAQFESRMALCGFGIPNTEELLFDTIRFQVGGLTELSGVTAFRKAQIPLRRTGDSNQEFIATLSNDGDQEWETESGDTLALDYVVQVNSDHGYRYDVSSYPVMEVYGEHRTADDWIDTYARPLAEITSFSTARKQLISWVELTTRGDH